MQLSVGFFVVVLAFFMLSFSHCYGEIANDPNTGENHRDIELGQASSDDVAEYLLYRRMVEAEKEDHKRQMMSNLRYGKRAFTNLRYGKRAFTNLRYGKRAEAELGFEKRGGQFYASGLRYGKRSEMADAGI